MKKIYLFIIAAIISSCNLQAQSNWEKIDLPDSIKIHKLFCLDKNTLFGWSDQNDLGDREIIYKTSDGGENWKTVFKSPNQSKGFSPMIISFLNQNIGFLVVNESLYKTALYKTTDSGESWFRVGESPVFNTGTLKKILPVDENHIWILGNSFWISTDGGITFQERKMPTSVLCAIGYRGGVGYVISAGSVFILGKSGSLSNIVYNLPDNEAIIDFTRYNDFFVFSSDIAIFGGRNNLCVTKDGFKTITKYPYPKHPGSRNQIAFYDNAHGMFLRFNFESPVEKPELFYTKNGGKSWIVEEIEDEWICDIAGKDGVWYCASIFGEVYKTNKSTGIPEIELFPVVITPNPVVDNFHIECGYGYGEVKLVEIYDVTGREVFRQESPKQNRVNIQHLTNGVYISKIYTENKIFQTKILKQ